MKLLAVLLLALTLSACSPFGMITGMFSSTPDVDVQVGKTNEKVTGINTDEFAISKIEDNTKAEEVNKAEDAVVGNVKGDVSIDERVPFWIWFVAILGWLLPSPIEIYKGLGKLFINIKRYIKE
jgi:hypothetical protein